MDCDGVISEVEGVLEKELAPKFRLCTEPFKGRFSYITTISKAFD
jgi:hypothetical protein